MKPGVLVTGGAGFIGAHVAGAYLAAGYEVTILDNLSTGRLEHVPQGARLVHADVRSPQARDLVAGGGFALLNHHAAQVDVQSSVADPVTDASVNLLGFLNLLQGAHTGGVRRIILASSGGALYGNGAILPTDEIAPKLPASPYGAGKLATEYYLATFARLYGIEAVVLRYSNVYGPRQRADGEGGVVAIFARRACEGEPLLVYGDGEQTRDMVHVADVAAANIAASKCPPARAPIETVDQCAYNIGTGVETSVNRLAALVAEASRRGGGCAVRVRHAPERAGEIRRSALACGKAAREIGWRSCRSLVEGIQSTVDWIAATRDSASSPV